MTVTNIIPTYQNADVRKREIQKRCQELQRQLALRSAEKKESSRGGR